jgi:hypothetical protein
MIDIETAPGAPALLKNKYGMSSDAQLVLKVEMEAIDAYQYRKPEFERLERNTRGYSGLDGGSYNEEELQDLDEQDREAAILNICRPKVETFAGTMMSAMYDVDYKPVTGARRSDTEAMRTSWIADKELYDYYWHMGECLRDMGIQCSEMKLEIDTTFDGLPRAKFVHKNPAFIIRDPYWISKRDSECESLHEVYHLSAKQLTDIFEAKGPEVEQAYREWVKQGGNYRETDTDFYGQVKREFKGHLFRVIEHHWLDTIRTTQLIGRTKDEARRLYNFPITKDKKVLEQFINLYNIDTGSLNEIPIKEKIHMVTIVCPSLLKNALLSNGKAKVQVGPRLPYYHLAMARVNGKDLGIVDSLLYANRQIDQQTSKLTDMISNRGGAKIANADAFQNPNDKTEFQEGFNDPKRLFFADGDAFKKGQIIQTTDTSGYPEQAAISQLVRIFEMVDRLSHIPAALDSTTESASEPGVVYDRKIQVAQIALYLSTSAVKQFVNDLGEGYMYVYKATYNGPRRDMTTRDGKRSATINKKVPIDGEVYVQNVPALTPRCSVIVTESALSPTKNAADRAQLLGIFKDVAATHPEYSTVIINKILNTYELDDETKAKLEQIKALQEQRDMAKMRSEIATMDAQASQAIAVILQTNMQMQQMMAQAQGPQSIQEAPPVPLQDAQTAANGGMPREMAQPTQTQPMAQNAMA